MNQNDASPKLRTYRVTVVFTCTTNPRKWFPEALDENLWPASNEQVLTLEIEEQPS